MQKTLIKQIDTGYLRKAEIINVSNTKLDNFKTANLGSLLELFIAGCTFETIDFAPLIKLVKLGARGAKLTAIKVSKTGFKFALEELYLSDSAVKIAELEKMPNLRVLFVDGSALRAVKLGINTKLARLRYNPNQCSGFKDDIRIELAAANSK